MVYSPERNVSYIIQNWERLRSRKAPTVDLSIRLRPFEILFLAGYFDGASQHSRCGCGAWLMLSPSCHYKIYWHGGSGTNMRGEVLALWGLLWFVNQLCIEKMWVYRDSKVLIDHLKLDW